MSAWSSDIVVPVAILNVMKKAQKLGTSWAGSWLAAESTPPQHSEQALSSHSLYPELGLHLSVTTCKWDTTPVCWRPPQNGTWDIGKLGQRTRRHNLHMRTCGHRAEIPGLRQLPNRSHSLYCCRLILGMRQVRVRHQVHSCDRIREPTQAWARVAFACSPP